MRGKARFSPEQKTEIVLTVLGGKVSMAELCREHQVSATMVYRWKDAFLEAGKRGLENGVPRERQDRQEREIVKLKEIVGDLAVANHLLKGGRTFSMGNEGGRV